jgi:hypothetical protein
MNLRKIDSRGTSLPAALIIVFVICVMIAASFEFTNNVGRHTQGAGAVESAIAVADGSLDYLFANWRHTMRTSPNLAPATSEFSGIATPTAATYFPDMAQCTVQKFGVAAVDPLLQPLASATTAPPKQTGRGPGTYNYTYLASVDVDVKTVSRTVTQKVRRVFQKRVQSPWNFAVFYQDALEIQPSAPLTLSGWVHSNDNLYTGSNKLTLTDRLTTAGTWNIGYAPGDGAHTASATSPNYPANEPPAQENTFQAFALDPKLLSTTDTNPNNDTFREIAQVPNSSYTDPFASQRYYNQAGVKVLINGSGKLTIMNQTGAVCTASSKGNDLAIYQTITNAIKIQSTFQDNREGAKMTVWDVDLAPIASSSMSWNNILYVSDQSATASNHRGLRLKNGDTLPGDGLTFVTDNALYLQGDWNTGASPPSSAAGNPDSTQPLDPKYSWRPSAIIADAITLLSNSWQDGNASKGVSARTAGNTTVNAAIVTGIVPSGTSGNNYSGGAENLVRFLEDWTGKTFTYYGSMLELYSSAQAVGAWGKANVYNPATLKWSFDDKFTLTSPPGTAIMISYVQQRWFQE